MNPVEDRVVRALRARAEEADMSQSTLNRNHSELMNRIAAGRSSRTRLLLAAAAAVVLLALGGAGLWVAFDRGQEGTADTLPAASDPGQERAEALVGGDFAEFKRTITEEELSAAGLGDLPSAEGRLNISGTRLNVWGSGGQKGLHSVTVLADGTWQIGPQNKEHSNFECTQTGTYTASLTGDVLTLRAIEDPCALRRAVLAGSWTR